MPFIGVRISCDILARKADLRRSLSSAFSLAFISSDFCRSLIMAMPMADEVAVRIELSASLQFSSEWQLSIPTKPQQFPSMVTGITNTETISCSCNGPLSDSGKSLTLPFTEIPLIKRSYQRGVTVITSIFCKSGLSIWAEMPDFAHSKRWLIKISLVTGWL